MNFIKCYLLAAVALLSKVLFVDNVKNSFMILDLGPKLLGVLLVLIFGPFLYVIGIVYHGYLITAAKVFKNKLAQNKLDKIKMLKQLSKKANLAKTNIQNDSVYNINNIDPVDSHTINKLIEQIEEANNKINRS